MNKVLVSSVLLGLNCVCSFYGQTSSSNISSGNVVDSSTIITTTTTTSSTTPVTTSIDWIMLNYRIASSGDFSIAFYQRAYYLSWKTTNPVTLIRGDFDHTYRLFSETTIYNGRGTLFYMDTVGNINTKYYVLSYPGGRIKIDINKIDLYTIVTDNLTTINHDNDTRQREVKVAVFGKVAIVKWFSVYEGFAVDLNYSGSVSTDYNINNFDNDTLSNYYIIDNLNNLSSITMYDVDANYNKTKVFSLAFNISVDPRTSAQTLILVGGTSQNVLINNGTMTTINDGITSNTVDNRAGIFVQGEDATLNNRTNATQEAMDTLNNSGSGGGGGGCFLSR